MIKLRRLATIWTLRLKVEKKIKMRFDNYLKQEGKCLTGYEIDADKRY